MKSNPDPWPWQENREAFVKLAIESVIRVAFNITVLSPLVAMSLLYLRNWKIENAISIEELPDSKTLFLNIVFCMICEDLTFHCTHRFLHWNKIYPYFHKIHHAHKQPVSFAAENAHPVEFVLGNMIPLMMGGIILGPHMHMYTGLLWGVVRILETHDTHSGYEFPFSPFALIPFSATGPYHDYHHTHNVGNYSTFFTIWDTVFGSNKAYFEYEAERQKSK